LTGGQVLPATVFESNPNVANVVSTDFTALATPAPAPELGNG
jgi:hypothetical protein